MFWNQSADFAIVTFDRGLHYWKHFKERTVVYISVFNLKSRFNLLSKYWFIRLIKIKYFSLTSSKTCLSSRRYSIFFRWCRFVLWRKKRFFLIRRQKAICSEYKYISDQRGSICRYNWISYCLQFSLWFK